MDIATVTSPQFDMHNIIRLAQAFQVQCLSFGSKIYSEVLKMDFGKEGLDQIPNVTRMKIEINKGYFPDMDRYQKSYLAPDPTAKFRFPQNMIELTLTNFNFQKDIQLISAINRETLRSLTLIKP